MTDEQAIILDVNGVRHRVDAGGTTSLMHVLRNDLALKGVRVGCSIGECGACRVIMDGDSVASCQTPISEAIGAQITTPEGLGRPESPHPVQQAFLHEQAGQCGYCVNGMIVSVAARLQKQPDVDAAGLRDTLSSHLCRCGTHIRMLRAARRAAGMGEDLEATDIPADGPDAPIETDVPHAVRAHPEISSWVELGDAGDVHFYPGKVELGQGVRTAFTQIVASQLGVPVERVHAHRASTQHSPDQGQTSGTFSIEHGGTALAMAARALRRVLTGRAADKLGCPAEEVRLDEDGAVAASTAQRLSFETLKMMGPVEGTIRDDDRPDWATGSLGESLAREDLRAKLTGAPAYLHDLTLPGMLHARAVLPPSYGSAPQNFDFEFAQGLSGVVEVVKDGRLIVIVAEREEQVIRAQGRLTARIQWQDPDRVTEKDTEDLLRALPAEEYVRQRDADVDELLGSLRGHSASYMRPYQAHGPMSPSAAVAVAEDGGGMRIWTHSQGIYPLRREIAAHLDLPEERLVVEHMDGPGCYGLTGADDAALLAAIAARTVPGRPTRLQLSVQEEFGWDPYGSAMVGDLHAALDEAGGIRAWRHHVISDSHSTRPNGDGNRLLASWLGSRRRERPRVGHGEPSARNALPMYDIPSLDVTSLGVAGPLRTGPLRSLGAFFNLFAAESFIDELADIAGTDRLAYRLAHLRDERAKFVLERAAEQAGWHTHVGPSGRGIGIALARYKDSKAYVALAAQVRTDMEQEGISVTRIVVLCDPGTVVNAAGLRNQLEGGVVQGLSRTLYEELTLAEGGVRERDWTTYPRIGFADIPAIDVMLVKRDGYPPLGVGEVATPLVAPAVANAIDDAIGVRMRQLPLTTANLERRLAELDDAESARVLFQ